MPPVQNEEYPSDIPYFQKCACCENYSKDDEHDSLHLARKHAGMFVLGHNLFFKAQFSSSSALEKQFASQNR